jgi:hypothetical protein
MESYHHLRKRASKIVEERLKSLGYLEIQKDLTRGFIAVFWSDRVSFACLGNS